MYKKLSGPVVAQIEVSALCPNRCLQCYNYWRKDDSTLSCANLSLDDAGHIMSELIKSKVFHVVLTGGEPLMNKKSLFRLIELAIANGITVGINSSLIGLTCQDARRFKELKVSSVLTSLMGPNAEVHDYVAQHKGAFTKTLAGIKLLQEFNVPVYVNMVVFKENLNFLKQTAMLTKSLGVEHFSSTRAGCPGNCPDFSDFSLSLGEFRDYLKNLHEVGEKCQISVGVLESYPLCAIKEVKKYKAFTGRHCLAGVTTITIGADGEVRPCSHLDVAYGNILNENLAIIWERMSEWRDGSLIPDDCKACKAFPWCGGGCRMESKMRNGSLMASDPYRVIEDSDYVFDQLTSSSRTVSDLPIGTRFSLNPNVRWRREKFGGIVFVSHRFALYLNSDALNFLSGLKAGELYKLEGDDQPTLTFLAKLLDKKIVLRAKI